jgi:hypothetical protein
MEWWYFWGKLSNGNFFHYANFRAKLGGFIAGAMHFSLHNKESKYWEEIGDDFGEMQSETGYLKNRFHFSNKIMGMSCIPNVKPVVHKDGYYSIPSLAGEGHIYPDQVVTSDVWFDHEFKDIKKSLFKDWEWVGVKLDCGICIMAYKGKEEDFCSVSWNKSNTESKFVLENKHFFVNDLGMYLTLEPIVEEKIFYPKFGIPYSEVPFNVVSKGSVIGTGMKEKTYRKENQNA